MLAADSDSLSDVVSGAEGHCFKVRVGKTFAVVDFVRDADRRVWGGAEFC